MRYFFSIFFTLLLCSFACAEQEVIIKNPSLKGLAENNAPYEIKAKEGWRHSNGDFSMQEVELYYGNKENAGIRLTANKGQINEKNKKILLNNASIFYKDWVLRSKEINFDLLSQSAHGDKKARVTFHKSSMSANKFAYDNKNKKLKLRENIALNFAKEDKIISAKANKLDADLEVNKVVISEKVKITDQDITLQTSKVEITYKNDAIQDIIIPVPLKVIKANNIISAAQAKYSLDEAKLILFNAISSHGKHNLASEQIIIYNKQGTGTSKVTP